MVRFQPSYAHNPTTAGAPSYIQVRTAKQKLVLGTCAVGAAQWARRGRTSKITESLRRPGTGRRVTSPWASEKARALHAQAEARGEHMSNHRAAAACPYQPPTAPGRRKRREVPRKEASLSCGHTKPHSGGHRLIFYQKLLICKTALEARPPRKLRRPAELGSAHFCSGRPS